MANVLFCLAVLVIVIFGYLKTQSVSKTIVFLVLSLFVLLNISLFIDSDIDGFVILVNLLLFIIILKQVQKQGQTELSVSKNKPISDSTNLLIHAKEQERSRIYANLHDDVGAKLLELIYTAKDESSKSLAKDVLSKIRHAVASTENIQCTVDQLIDTLIHEAKLRLKTSNIHLIESIKIENPKKKLATTMPMSLIRIVREVLSNAIKHAQAQEIEFVFFSDDNQLEIKIIDDGKGFDKNHKDSKSPSKGFQTISKRADSISAKTSFKSIPGVGTTFTLKYIYAHQ